MNTVAEAVPADSDHASTTRDFWLLYPVANDANTFLDVLDALYYLPKSYKVMVLSDESDEGDLDMSGYADLAARVQYQAQMSPVGHGSPFYWRHALISDDTTPDIVKRSLGSQIVVSKSAKSPLKESGQSGFIVACNNPLALASAVHRLARTAET